MNTVVGCIDGLSNTPALIDCAAWAALRLKLPLEFLHVLDGRAERAQLSDYGGGIGLQAHDSLLNELIALDGQRSGLAQAIGQRLLASARERALSAGVSELGARLRHGEFVDNLQEMEPDTRMFVLGEHFRATGRFKRHLDHNVERVIRSVKRPVLVATGERFDTPKRFVLAFDASPTAYKVVEMVARSPLLAGLPGLVVMVDSERAQSRRDLERVRLALLSAGFDVAVELVPGEPEQVLPALVKAHGDALLVMGAYGHSRIRQLIVGSTTTTLLRLSQSPVLVLR